MGAPTPLSRIRRLIDLLMQRGPSGFEEFLHSLDDNGYDHVAFRIRNTPGPSSTDGSSYLDKLASASSKPTNNDCNTNRHTSNSSEEGSTKATTGNNTTDAKKTSNDNNSVDGNPPTTLATSSAIPAELEIRSRRLMHTSTGFVTVEESRRVEVVGNSCHKTLSDLSRSATVPDNVFLTSSLDSARDMPLAVDTDVRHKSDEARHRGRMRRDTHPGTMSTHTEDEDFATAASVTSHRSSLTDDDRGERKGKSLDDRLKKIEESWFILSRRVTRVEDRSVM